MELTDSTSSFQCLDTVILCDRKGIYPVKKPVTIITKDSPTEQMEQENQGRTGWHRFIQKRLLKHCICIWAVIFLTVIYTFLSVWWNCSLVNCSIVCTLQWGWRRIVCCVHVRVFAPCLVTCIWTETTYFAVSGPWNSFAYSTLKLSCNAWEAVYFWYWYYIMPSPPDSISEGIMFSVCPSTFVRFSFVWAVLVTTISYEWLEQSRWKFQGIFTNQVPPSDDLIRFWRSGSQQIVAVAKASMSIFLFTSVVICGAIELTF